MDKVKIIIIIIVCLGLAFVVWKYRNTGYTVLDSKIQEQLILQTSTTTVATSTQLTTTSPKDMKPVAPSMPEILKKNGSHLVTIETNKGTIIFETYDTDAPLAVTNFINLAQSGYYNGVIFHRVISGFMIQGGDPTGTGRGGPGYRFEDELNPNTPSAKAGYQRGVVAMANAGPDTNGSQFFIMHATYPLPHNYTIFGKVVSGIEVVDAIASTPTDPSDRPSANIVMNSVSVQEK